MAVVPVMWGTWGFLVLISVALYLYRSTLARNEDVQIFLDDSSSHEKAAQAAIITKVNKVAPLLHAFTWLLGAATLFVVGYYLWDVFIQFK